MKRYGKKQEFDRGGRHVLSGANNPWIEGKVSSELKERFQYFETFERIFPAVREMRIQLVKKFSS